MMLSPDVIAVTPVSLALQLPQVQELIDPETLEYLATLGSKPIAELPGEAWVKILSGIMKKETEQPAAAAPSITCVCRNCGFLNFYEQGN